jgi:hypothetical protein
MLAFPPHEPRPGLPGPSPYETCPYSRGRRLLGQQSLQFIRAISGGARAFGPA